MPSTATETSATAVAVSNLAARLCLLTPVEFVPSPAARIGTPPRHYGVIARPHGTKCPVTTLAVRCWRACVRSPAHLYHNASRVPSRTERSAHKHLHLARAGRPESGERADHLARPTVPLADDGQVRPSARHGTFSATRRSAAPGGSARAPSTAARGWSWYPVVSQLWPLHAPRATPLSAVAPLREARQRRRADTRRRPVRPALFSCCSGGGQRRQLRALSLKDFPFCRQSRGPARASISKPVGESATVPCSALALTRARIATTRQQSTAGAALRMQSRCFVAWYLLVAAWSSCCWHACSYAPINGSTVPPPPRFCILNDNRLVPPEQPWSEIEWLLRLSLTSATPELFLEELSKLQEAAQITGKYELYRFFAYDRDVGHSALQANLASACPRFPLWTSFDWVSKCWGRISKVPCSCVRLLTRGAHAAIFDVPFEEVQYIALYEGLAMRHRCQAFDSSISTKVCNQKVRGKSLPPSVVPVVKPTPVQAGDCLQGCHCVRTTCSCLLKNMSGCFTATWISHIVDAGECRLSSLLQVHNATWSCAIWIDKVTVSMPDAIAKWVQHLSHLFACSVISCVFFTTMNRPSSTRRTL
eukprot:scaffold957_cov402-Prasinococcus_capsulatus_cf.AAC.10